MTEEKHTASRPGLLEIAFKAVQATLATLAVYRAARAAINAWQGVIEMVRGAPDEQPEQLSEPEAEREGASDAA